MRVIWPFGFAEILTMTSKAAFLVTEWFTPLSTALMLPSEESETRTDWEEQRAESTE